jgi:hypothetical protein
MMIAYLFRQYFMTPPDEDETLAPWEFIGYPHEVVSESE